MVATETSCFAVNSVRSGQWAPGFCSPAPPEAFGRGGDNPLADGDNLLAGGDERRLIWTIWPKRDGRLLDGTQGIMCYRAGFDSHDEPSPGHMQGPCLGASTRETNRSCCTTHKLHGKDVKPRGQRPTTNNSTTEENSEAQRPANATLTSEEYNQLMAMLWKETSNSPPFVNTTGLIGAEPIVPCHDTTSSATDSETAAI
ncbi:hypothetical protein LWI29_002047 [Acer saccharum]|uniref:Uncharacterized protein n=1 Tax=Acer saccharum TaxID=4024 RepID=A0AA39VFB0_ACESA|nr:hypothetical protein LWI29_002047 [Acer saccharum]